MKPENAQDIADRPANYADSIEAAAGALGRSAVFLQRLKAMGCAAFRAGRVYLEEVESYITEQNLEELEKRIDSESQVDVDLKLERLRRAKHENDVREGRFITREEHDESMARFNLEVKSALQAAMEDRGPDLLTMRTREEAQDVLRKLFDEMCQKLSHR